ncbi:MAG: hypothetical protein ACD_4C00246G0002 [uncultured bacterium (gcode 4)]|uniref:Uncharacterized protein n=1 Tax=uncultured bacterium (gcode 4) TaxID=1234023 RepID=K2GT53_9BACT|nr:MAG: hypothetical protein ACD_4C00246G0002 [uncultured bacterium (gcode 4)]
MFIVDWIILKKVYIKENKSIIHLYSKEFWKISAWIKESKLKYPVDLWNIINVWINIKWNINNIDSYKIKKTLNYNNLSFESIQNILELITYLYRLIPEWVPSESLFDEYIEIMELLEKNETNKRWSEFYKLKLVIKSWIWLHWEKSENFKKIIEFSKNNKITKMMQIKWISENLLNEITKYNFDSYSLYLT